MKHRIRVSAVTLALLAGVSQAQALELDGISVSRDIPCKGEDVSITGNGNQFRLSGECGQVEVHGSEQVIVLVDAKGVEITGIANQVQAERIDQLDVSGGGHRVEASLRGEPERAAPVAVYGADNILTLGFDGPANVDISGSGHQLEWHGDEPQITTSGSDHQIERR
ncbi:DUF3060 domain-containing protein [Pseudomonas borbori]